MPIRGEQYVALASTRVGEAYILGFQVPKNDANFHGDPHAVQPHKKGYDCAEFTSWTDYQITGKLCGCRGPKLADGTLDPAKADAYTGYYAEDAHAGVIQIVPVDTAIRTPGALLLRVPGAPGSSGHIVISDGVGGTVEAMGTAYGVVRGKSVGRSWSLGLYLPGVLYTLGPKVVPVTIPTTLRMGSHGTAVANLQRELNALSVKLAKPAYSVGTVDGDFGAKTGAAVVAFQKDHGLTVDGEVGPRTQAALDAA